MAGLRERRHEETRLQLVDAAFALFAEHGYDAVTMEAIAQAAGVSRSTAYRRFPTKDDVILEVPRRWLGAFDDALAGLPDGTALPDAVRATCMAVARHIDDNVAMVRAAYAVLEEAPSLRNAGAATAAWFERTQSIIERFGQIDAETAGMLAGAYLGAIDAMMASWAADGGTGSVADRTDRVMVKLRPLLD